MSDAAASSSSVREISENIRNAVYRAVIVSDLAVEEEIRSLSREPVEDVTEVVLDFYGLATGQQVVAPETRAALESRVRIAHEHAIAELHGTRIRARSSTPGIQQQFIEALSDADLDTNWDSAEHKFAAANLELAKSGLSAPIVGVDGFRGHSWHAVLRDIAARIRRAPQLRMPSNAETTVQTYSGRLGRTTENLFGYALELRPNTIQRYIEMAVTELNQAEATINVSAVAAGANTRKVTGKKQGMPCFLRQQPPAEDLGGRNGADVEVDCRACQCHLRSSVFFR